MDFGWKTYNCCTVGFACHQNVWLYIMVTNHSLISNEGQGGNIPDTQHSSLVHHLVSAFAPLQVQGLQAGGRPVSCQMNQYLYLTQHRQWLYATRWHKSKFLSRHSMILTQFFWEIKHSIDSFLKIVTIPFMSLVLNFFTSLSYISLLHLFYPHHTYEEFETSVSHLY